MRKRFVKRLLGLSIMFAMTFTGAFGPMSSITSSAEENVEVEELEASEESEESKEAEEVEEIGELDETEETEELEEVLEDSGEPEEKEDEESEEEEKDELELELKSIVVNTEVTKLGQYPVSIDVTFENALDENISLSSENFSISANKSGWLASGITERDIPVAVESVKVSDDRTGITIYPDQFPDRYYYVPEYTVTCNYDGAEYFSFTKEDVTKTVTPVADEFKHIEDGGFSYNIYEPATDEKVPVVVVFHGFGDDENLYANRTAVEWAEKANQSKRPAYVIAPQFGGYSYISSAARERVYDSTKNLIDSLVQAGKVDAERIYITGKSFGGAAVFEFNERYPDYPAASIAMAPAVAYTNYFGGISDQDKIDAIKDNYLWIAQCEADSTAPYSGTVEVYDTLMAAGAKNTLFTTYSTEDLDSAGANGDYHAIETVVMEDERYADWLFSKSNKSAENDSLDYQVILPEGYKTSGASYPVIYVMPNDGLNSFSETALQQIQKTLDESAMDMIVVKVKLDRDDDPYSTVQEIIAEVDSKYLTLKDAKYRAVIGEEVGGYLAHALTYTDGNKKFVSSPKLFGLMASINGDYNSAENMWLDKLGDILSLSKLNNSTALKFYTYLSAASEDERAYSKNGANSIIKYFINNASAYGGFYTGYFGNADEYSQNFSIKNGEFDSTFEKVSVAEAVTGFNRRVTQKMVTGSLKLNPQSVVAAVEEVEAEYGITVSNAYNTFFGGKQSAMNVEIVMQNPDTGDVLERISVGDFNVSAGTKSGKINIPNIVKNVSTSVALVVTLQGTTFAVDTQDLVRVLDTGTAPEDQLIDFMGVWKVKPIADSAFKKSDWVDENGELTLGDYNSWGDGTPCITWWNGTNGVDRNFVGYAWYVREFEIPADFTRGTYQMPIGYLDEGDVTFINGVQVGQTGMTADTWQFESDQWDTYRSYEVSSDILNFGGKNYVAVLAHNKSGDGGWYKGHPGLYSQAAYNKLNSVPSELAEDEPTEMVKDAVEAQIAAMADGNLREFANTVAADYFQSGITKDRLLETVKSYGKAKVTDSEGTVFEAPNGLYLYQAKRTIKTQSGETISQDVSDYFVIKGKKALLYGEHDRFYTEYIDSANRAKALGSDKSTEKESFLVYLPEGYFDEANADKRYPVAYIFHQINSSSNSWKIDGINELLDKGIKEGKIKNTILVIPDSVPTSWWQGSWVDMVTEDIIPFVDENYRTVKDARFRFTVGASMGGSGSYNIGLRNPDLFSGIISYFGAINMGANPLNTARQQYEKGYVDYLRYYGQYFVCGNQDLYKFGVPAIELDELLRNVKIDHFFELEEGAHDSSFYKPYVIDSFNYMTARIPSVTAEEANSVISLAVKNAKVSNEKASAQVTVVVNDKMKDYLTTIPVSDFTHDTNPRLVVPVTVRLVDKNGVTVASATRRLEADDAFDKSVDFDLESYDISKNEEYTLVAAANLLDYPAVAAIKVNKKESVKPSTPSSEPNLNPAPETPASTANDTVAKIEEEKVPLAGETATTGTATAKPKPTGNKVVENTTEEEEVVAEEEPEEEVEVESQEPAKESDTEVSEDTSDDNTTAIEDAETPLAQAEDGGSINGMVVVGILVLLMAALAITIPLLRKRIK